MPVVLVSEHGLEGHGELVPIGNPPVAAVGRCLVHSEELDVVHLSLVHLSDRVGIAELESKELLVI